VQKLNDNNKKNAGCCPTLRHLTLNPAEMGRLRRGHSLEVIFEDETAEFQPSIARLEEEEYAITKSFRWLYVESVLLHIHPIFFHLFFFFFPHASAPEENGDTHKSSFFFPSTPSQKERKKRTPISCTSYTQNSRGIIFFLYPVVVSAVVGPD
jgi:hypothetical protein